MYQFGTAVRASSSFPAVFCPYEYEEHFFLDGGTIDNIPVEEVIAQRSRQSNNS